MVYVFLFKNLDLRGSGFRGLGSGVRDWGLGFMVQGSGCRVQRVGFRTQGSGCKVYGVGLWSKVKYSGLRA